MTRPVLVGRRAMRGWLAAAVAILHVACSSPAPSPLPTDAPPPIDGARWEAIEIAGRVPVAGAVPWVEFDVGAFRGSTGCNEVTGRVAFDAGRAVIADLVTTDVACPGPAGEQERVFLEALQATETAATEDDRLVLAGTAGVLRFARVAEALPALEGTSWRVVSIGNAQVLPDGAPTLEVRAGGSHGWSGCDAFGVDIEFRAGAVQVGEFTLRPEGCTGPGEELEQAFLSALREVTRFRLEGDDLLLEGGAEPLRLRRDAPAPGEPERQILEVLRSDAWQVAGAALPGAIAPIRFGDGEVLSAPGCGFSGTFTLTGRSGIRFSNIGHDAISCDRRADDATRSIVIGILEATTRIDVAAGGVEIILSGPAGELRLAPMEPRQ